MSVRRVEDIKQALWGRGYQPRRRAISIRRVITAKFKIDGWRQRIVVDDFQYGFLDGLWLKRSWGDEVKTSRR